MKHQSNRPLVTVVILFIIACAVYGCNRAKGQTITATTNQPSSFSNGLQEIYDSVAVSTNYALTFGAGRATTGNRNAAYADYVYDVSQNVGLVVGYDYLWTAKAAGVPSQANLVKGGITLSALIYPLKNFGLTNVAVTPFANVLLATGNGSASEIITAGGKVDLVKFGGGWNFGAVGFWETRKDAGYWTGDYIFAGLVVHKGF